MRHVTHLQFSTLLSLQFLCLYCTREILACVYRLTPLPFKIPLSCRVKYNSLTEAKTPLMLLNCNPIFFCSVTSICIEIHCIAFRSITWRFDICMYWDVQKCWDVYQPPVKWWLQYHSRTAGGSILFRRALWLPLSSCTENASGVSSSSQNSCELKLGLFPWRCENLISLDSFPPPPTISIWNMRGNFEFSCDVIITHKVLYWTQYLTNHHMKLPFHIGFSWLFLFV